jgi:hypothetical protein
VTLANDLLAEINNHCETKEQLDAIGRLVMKYQDEKKLTAEEYAAIVEAGKFRRYVVNTPTPWS